MDFGVTSYLCYLIRPDDPLLDGRPMPGISSCGNRCGVSIISDSEDEEGEEGGEGGEGGDDDTDEGDRDSVKGFGISDSDVEMEDETHEEVVVDDEEKDEGGREEEEEEVVIVSEKVNKKSNKKRKKLRKDSNTSVSVSQGDTRGRVIILQDNESNGSSNKSNSRSRHETKKRRLN